jgi:hypothetical protein
MYNFLTKNGQTISFLVGLVITVIFLVTAFGGLEEFNMLDKDTRRTSDIFNFGISAAAGLVIIAFIFMIVAIFLNVILNIKGNLRLVIGLVIMLALYFIFSGSATYEPTGTLLGDLLAKNNISPGANGFIVGGVLTAVVLFGLAWASFIILEIVNFFK